MKTTMDGKMGEIDYQRTEWKDSLSRTCLFADKPRMSANHHQALEKMRMNQIT